MINLVIRSLGKEKREDPGAFWKGLVGVSQPRLREVLKVRYMLICSVQFTVE